MVPQPESGGTDPKRAKTEVAGASHKDNTLRITAAAYPLVLTLMERSKSEMAFWEGLARLYEESAGVARQEAPARRLQDMWPLRKSLPEEDQWQEKFFPILRDKDDGLPPLVTISQVPSAQIFLEWAKEQDATIDRDTGGTELEDAEWRKVKPDLLAKAVFQGRNTGFVNTYAFWHPLGDLDKVAIKLIPPAKLVPRRLALRWMRCALATDST